MSVENARNTTTDDLCEAALFQPRFKGANQLRMAADWLVDEYKCMRGGQLSPADHYIPAYAAHALWTFAGQRIETKIGRGQIFSRPAQVLARAEELNAANPDKTRGLIARIAKAATAPKAVRELASRWTEMNL